MCKSFSTEPGTQGLVNLSLAMEFKFYFIDKEEAMESMAQADCASER